MDGLFNKHYNQIFTLITVIAYNMRIDFNEIHQACLLTLKIMCVCAQSCQLFVTSGL